MIDGSRGCCLASSVTSATAPRGRPGCQIPRMLPAGAPGALEQVAEGPPHPRGWGRGRERGGDGAGEGNSFRERRRPRLRGRRALEAGCGDRAAPQPRLAGSPRARGRACGRRALLAPRRFCGGHQPPAGATAGGSCRRGRAESRAGAAGRASAPAGALPRGAPHRAGTSLPVARGRALGRARRLWPHLPTRSEAPAPRGALVAGAGTPPPLARPPPAVP